MVLHYPAKHDNEKYIFALKCCITTLLDFNQSMLDFFNVADLQLTLTLSHDCLNLVVNGVQLWAVGGHSSRERNLRVLRCRAVGLCCAQCAPCSGELSR